MAQIIEVPGFGLTEFPDGMSHREIEVAIKNVMMKQPKQATPSVSEDVLKAIPSAIPKAAAGLIGLPQTGIDLMGKGIKWAGEQFGAKPNANSGFDQIAKLQHLGKLAREGWDKITGGLYEPKTMPGRIADFATQVAASGPKPSVAGATVGLVGGGANEAANNWFPDNAGARFVTTALPMLATGGILGARGTPAETINQALKNVSPDQLKAAQALMDDAAKAGVQLTGAEAIAQVTGKNALQNVQRVVEQSPKGGPTMERITNARPEQVRGAFTGAADAIGPLPAKPSQTPVNLQQAGEGAIVGAKKARTAASSPFYKAQADIDKNAAAFNEFGTLTTGPQVQGLMGKINDALINAAPTEKKILKNLKAEIAPGGKPLELPSQIDSAYKTVRGLTNIPKIGATSEQSRTAGVVGEFLKDLEAISLNSSANIAQGRQVYRDMSRNVVDPMKASPVGDIAKTGGIANAESQMGAQSQILMPQAPRALNPDTIKQTAQTLATQNPAALKDWTRQNIQGIFDEASQNLVSGANQFSGSKFAAQIAGNPSQKANLQALVESTGGRDAWTGFNRFLEIAEATGKRQPVGSQTAFNTQAMGALSGGGAGRAPALVASPNRLFSAVGDWYDQFRYGKNTAQMADILTNPQSIGLMQELAHTAPRSAKAQMLTGLLVNANAQGFGQSNPLQQKTQ